MPSFDDDAPAHQPPAGKEPEQPDTPGGTEAPSPSRGNKKQEKDAVVPFVFGFLLIVIAGLHSYLKPHLPFLDQISPWFLGGVGFLLLLLARWLVYDAQPIPQTNVPAPAPLQLPDDEEWRLKSTHIRFVEKLKGEVIQKEEQMRKLHQLAVEDHRGLLTSSGMSEYNRRIENINLAARRIPEIQKELDGPKKRIEAVLGGHVQVELLDIAERIKKRELDIRDSRVELSKEQQPLIAEMVRDRINRIERELIELRTDQEELQALRSSPLTPGTRAPEKSDEDMHFEAAQRRRALDRRWKIQKELGDNVRTMIELQQWRKEERLFVHDSGLSAAEKDEALDYIDRLYEERKQKLLGRSKRVKLYEEE